VCDDAVQYAPHTSFNIHTTRLPHEELTVCRRLPWCCRNAGCYRTLDYAACSKLWLQQIRQQQ
jgi:hypothetical protein